MKYFYCNSILTQALRNNSNMTGFELLIDNWGTMEEWGRSSSGRRPRPNLKDLLTLCRIIDNYRAASYVNHDILGSKKLIYFDTENYCIYIIITII